MNEKTKPCSSCPSECERTSPSGWAGSKEWTKQEEFLRSLILGAQLQTKPCEHHAELLRKIAGLCNNANQLAHVANGTGRAGEASIQEMLRISKETWRLVKEEW